LPINSIVNWFIAVNESDLVVLLWNMNVCGAKVDFKWPVSSVIFNLATTDSGLLTDSRYLEIVRLSVCLSVRVS